MSTIATPNQKLLVGVPANSSERVLVNHPTQSATAIDGWKSVLFGLPFFAAGIFIGAVALDYVSGKKHAPDWLIGLIGFFFFAAGAFLMIHGLRGVIRKTKYDREARQVPDQLWLCDYHWHREGFAFSAFNSMLLRFVAAVVWNAFLTPFFWIGLTQRGAWFFAIVAALFALIGLVFWYRWGQMLAALLRYGNTFLDYNTFPFFLGSSVSARLRAPNHLSDLDEFDPHSSLRSGALHYQRIGRQSQDRGRLFRTLRRLKNFLARSTCSLFESKHSHGISAAPVPTHHVASLDAAHVLGNRSQWQILPRQSPGLLPRPRLQIRLVCNLA